MSFVHCDNLVKIYKVADLEVVALQGVDLEIDKGEMMAIVGASGSGKSSLLNILGGLDKPSAGKIRVGNYDLTRLKKREQVAYRRKSVGFVWQQTARNLIPYLTAKQNVELPMALNRLNKREREARAVELLNSVGLGDRLNHLPRNLSGGQQQRVAIAIAMANFPDLLLADEPTGQVDSEAANTIFDAMLQLNQHYGVTVVIVTHDYTVSDRVERVITMRDGHMMNEFIRDNNSDLDPTEYALVDRGGRLQLPQEYLDKLSIADRVRLQLHADYVAVYPASKRESNE
ncbi:MAG: ABC transporter ATP-binding protein [Aggregatilineales bacterium]